MTESREREALPLHLQFSADYLRAYMEGEPQEARRHLDKLIAALAARASLAGSEAAPQGELMREEVHPGSLRGLVEHSGGTYLTGGGAVFTSIALARFVVECRMLAAGSEAAPAELPERPEPYTSADFIGGAPECWEPAHRKAWAGWHAERQNKRAWIKYAKQLRAMLMGRDSASSGQRASDALQQAKERLAAQIQWLRLGPIAKGRMLDDVPMMNVEDMEVIAAALAAAPSAVSGT